MSIVLLYLGSEHHETPCCRSHIAPPSCQWGKCKYWLQNETLRKTFTVVVDLKDRESVGRSKDQIDREGDRQNQNKRVNREDDRRESLAMRGLLTI